MVSPAPENITILRMSPFVSMIITIRRHRILLLVIGAIALLPFPVHAGVGMFTGIDWPSINGEGELSLTSAGFYVEGPDNPPRLLLTGIEYGLMKNMSYAVGAYPVNTDNKYRKMDLTCGIRWGLINKERLGLIVFFEGENLTRRIGHNAAGSGIKAGGRWRSLMISVDLREESIFLDPLSLSGSIAWDIYGYMAVMVGGSIIRDESIRDTTWAYGPSLVVGRWEGTKIFMGYERRRRREFQYDSGPQIGGPGIVSLPPPREITSYTDVFRIGLELALGKPTDWLSR